MKPISQAKIKFVKSLKRKKYRKKEGAFVIEGLKSCLTAIDAGGQAQFFVYQEVLKDNVKALDGYKCYFASSKVMKSLSSLSSPPEVLGIFSVPLFSSIDDLKEEKGNVVFLDQIQDPGNLGAILRTADWFGALAVVLSPGCVDVFNPKTIQATMGSLLSVTVYDATFNELKRTLDDWVVLAFDMNGEPSTAISSLHGNRILVIGSEGQGLSPQIRNQSDLIITIEGHDRKMADSLNASVALGIGLYFTSTL